MAYKANHWCFMLQVSQPLAMFQTLAGLIHIRDHDPITELHKLSFNLKAGSRAFFPMVQMTFEP